MCPFVVEFFFPMVIKKNQNNKDSFKQPKTQQGQNIMSRELMFTPPLMSSRLFQTQPKGDKIIGTAASTHSEADSQRPKFDILSLKLFLSLRVVFMPCCLIDKRKNINAHGC